LNNDIQKNKLQILGNLFASLTHEIRNPLSVLKMNIDLIRDYQKDENEDIGDLLETSSEAILRIEKIIAHTLDFLRDNPDSYEYCSVNDIVSNSLDFIIPKAKKEGINIYTFLSSDIPKIKVVKNQIEQVLINLLTNSLEASEKGKIIQVRTNFDSENKKVNITITDDGIGIKNEHKDIVLNQFFTTKEGGNGLGLHVCKEIIDKHKGNLTFESEFEKGTTFCVSFSNYKV